MADRPETWEDLATDLFNLVLGNFEWVKAQGGSFNVCPLCRAVSDRDGGPGHQDDCQRFAYAGRFAALRASGTRPVMVHDDQLAAPQTPDLAALLETWRKEAQFELGRVPAIFDLGQARARVDVFTKCADELEAQLAAALRTSPAPPIGWQDIATAPKDGSLLWLIEDGAPLGLLRPHYFAGFWHPDSRYVAGGCWRVADRDSVGSPTAWMPLPPSRGIAQTDSQPGAGTP